MVLATQTDPEQHPKFETGNDDVPRRLACLGCGNHLNPVNNARAPNGEWVIRSRCPDCGLSHVHRRKHPPTD